MASFRILAPALILVLGALTGGTAQAPSARTTPLRGTLEQRLATLLDQAPFDRATWGVFVQDDRGDVLFARNAERLFIPASNTKLVVTSAASVLLPPTFRIRTSVYVNGAMDRGIVAGDLILYGRGDPSFSTRCYATDTLVPGVCDSSMAIMGALADSLIARGIRRVTGRMIGDGSYFEPLQLHPRWELFDAGWWYAAPVSGLAFNDNSIDFRISPGRAVDAPPVVTWTPDVGLVAFENRARTVASDSGSTIGDLFFRRPGTWEVWAEGTVALRRHPWTESFAVPDPNLYAARALASALLARGVAVEGGSASVTDSLVYRGARATPPLVERAGRPLDDLIFPILNTSQNTFAEYLLKAMARELGGVGSWQAGLELERRFLVDSVGIDSTAFWLDDGSGLSAGNLITPSALVRLLDYMWRHPSRAVFLRGIPRSGQRGSLLRRFVGTPVDGRVAAKTGSITHVNTLAGYLERRDGRRVTFAIMANGHAVPSAPMLAQIDSLVVEIGKTR